MRPPDWLNKVLIGLLVGVLGAWLLASGELAPAERASLDWMFRFRGPRTTNQKMALVLVDDDTESRWTEPTAFWLDKWAKTIEAIAACKPKWIVVDVLFETDTNSALKRHGASGDLEGRLVDALSSHSDQLTLACLPLPDGTVKRSHSQFSTGAQLVGHEAAANVDLDPDGLVRRTHLGFGRYLSIAAQAASAVQGSEGDVDRLRSIAKVKSANEPFLINYLGGRVTQISAWRAESGQLSTEDKETLKDAIVVVGGSYDAKDRKLIPLGTIPGSEVHANAIATLLDARGLETVRLPSVWVTGLALALIYLATQFVSPGIVVPTLIAGALAWLASCINQFSQDRVMPLGPPLIAVGLVCALGLLIRLISEWRKRSEISELFGKSVSNEVRNYLLASDSIDQRGREMVGSILFFDVRDSVTRGYSRTPYMLFVELNELMEAVTPAVARNHGLISRFTGDGFLALFGAPAPDRKHADRAFQAGVDILEAIDALNKNRQGDLFRGSCGVHSGTFTGGNLGSMSRAEFTVIGDVVNTAARVEGANRELETHLLISRETFELLSAKNPDWKYTTVKAKGRPDVGVYIIR